MSPLAIIWFLLIGVLIFGYFALDGFDLGAGVLYPVLGRSEADRAVIRRSIGPVWDGNEVWLLTAGGALFAAFAPAYATSFSGFYLAIMLVLFGLIVRAVSLEFRAHDAAWARLYDVMFVVGSLLPALLCGVAVGNVIAGIPLDANGDFTGTFFTLLTPFTLSCGVLGLVHMLVQGSAWIALKAPEDAEGAELAERARALRGKLVLAEALVFAFVSAVPESHQRDQAGVRHHHRACGGQRPDARHHARDRPHRRAHRAGVPRGGVPGVPRSPEAGRPDVLV